MRRIKGATFALTAGAVFVLGLACDSAPDRIQLSNADSGRSVAVAVGGEIDVTLQTIGPGQYGNPAVSSDSVRFLGASAAGAPNPGGPRQLFRFEARTMGRAEVTIPREGGLAEGPATPAFSMTVEVY